MKKKQKKGLLETKIRKAVKKQINNQLRKRHLPSVNAMVTLGAVVAFNAVLLPAAAALLSYQVQKKRRETHVIPLKSKALPGKAGRSPY